MLARVSTSAVSRWRFALKVASYPKLLAPWLLGVAIAFEGRPLALAPLLVTLAYVLADLVFIVTANDVADVEVDAMKRAMFPETSKKTVPDGILSRRALALAALAAGMAALAIGVAGAAWLDRPRFAYGAALGLFVFVAYSLAPIRLNYRGGGELLEALGTGVVLPLLTIEAVRAPFEPASVVLLAPWTALCLASAIASGVSDEESDRAAGKRTFTSLFGNAASRAAVRACVAVGLLGWLGVTVLAPRHGVALLFGLSRLPSLHRLDRAALPRAWDAQRAWKGELHRLIWGVALVSFLVARL